MSLVHLSDVWADEWDAFVRESAEAWCWHSRRWLNVVREVVRNQDPVDRSFFIRDETGRVIGLCPVLIANVRQNAEMFREASYSGVGLPWPCISPHIGNQDRVLAAAMAAAEALAVSAGAEVIRFRAAGPQVDASSVHFERVLCGAAYVDASYNSHLVRVHENTLTQIRGRVLRYLRKHAPKLDVSVAENAEVTDEIESAYYDLHVRDAGGQFRSRESYRLMAELARAGEGFFVVARLAATAEIIGILLVSVCGSGAYDSSVGVDPDHQDKYVSHALKYRAIRHLHNLGVTYYELGPVFGAATWTSIPSAKQRGITEFKRAWARSETTRVLVAEKYLTEDACRRHFARQADEYCAFWFGG